MSDETNTEDDGSGNDELDDLLDRAAAQEELDDDEVELDLSESASYEPFAGKFASIITKVEVVKAKTSGATMIKAEVTVTEEGEFKGRRAWPNLMLSGKGAYKTKQAFSAVGAPLDLDATPVKIKPKALLNVPLTASFTITPAQNGYKAKTEVDGFSELVVDSNDDLQ